MIISTILKHILKFPYQMGKHSCVFSGVHRTAFINICKVICQNLSCHCTASHVLASAHIGLIAPCCSIGTEGPGLATWLEELLPRWCGAGAAALRAVLCRVLDMSALLKMGF